MRTNSILLLIALSAVGTAAIAGPPAPAKAKKTAAKAPAVVYCAVTSEKIGDPSKSAGTSVYKGKTYYFCCAGCKPQFDKDPAKYAKAADAKSAPAEKDAKPATPKVPAKA